MAFDWTQYTGNLAWLPERTILFCRHGSHAYGTNIATSDEDFRGVAIAPREYYLGALSRFEQAVMNDPDFTVFDIHKFVSLASQCNPNVIEILFVDDSDRLHVSTLGERLLEMRDLFLTKRVRHTFAGYAHSQLKRIKTHHRWLMNPVEVEPTRADHGLPDKTLIPADQLAAAEAAIRQKLDGWSTDFLDDLGSAHRQAVSNRMAQHLAEIGVSMQEELWPGAARVLGMSDNFIELLAREKRYTAARREWTNYQTWKRERNPARAELEARSGFDTKHAMHLVRLLRMCREILETGRVLVKRPDAEELLSIRNGAWTYDRLVEWADRQDGELHDMAAASKLPKSPDVREIDRLTVEMVAEAIS
jgi:predicted nucleotidyltransferase